MSKTKLHELADFGQSIWLDYISRSLIDSGKLKKMVDLGVLGMTSNPTIFNQAISSGFDYDERIRRLGEQGKSTFEIYDELTIQDIRDAADLFNNVFEATDHQDGYVSLEINPELADKKEESISEGLRLFGKVNRPNLMIKVPATNIGTEVIEELIGHGVNVNATLIFSPKQYWETVSAYFKGLEKYTKMNGNLAKIKSVASIFVSRIDTIVDRLIDEKMADINDEDLRHILRLFQGKAAISNSVIIYDKFQQMFSSNYFGSLAQKGASIQRVLWASTGTKDPAYSDIKYMEELIAKTTVNTVPEKTLNAFMHHGQVVEALPGDIDKAQEIFTSLSQYGIDIDQIHIKLLEDGVEAFSKSFEALLGAIATKQETLCAKS